MEEALDLSSDRLLNKIRCLTGYRGIQLFETQVSERNVGTPDELLARILDAAADIKKR